MAVRSADSTANTVNIPTQGVDPVVLARAGGTPLRVLVRNTGGALLLLAYDPTALANPAPMAGTFRLPVGTSEVFVLMPKQTLAAVSAGAGGFASTAISEAIPQLRMES